MKMNPTTISSFESNLTILCYQTTQKNLISTPRLGEFLCNNGPKRQNPYNFMRSFEFVFVIKKDLESSRRGHF